MAWLLSQVTGAILGRVRWPDAWQESCEGGAEIVEEGDFEFGAGLGEADHDVAVVAAAVADRPARDFALGDEDANVAFQGVGVEGNLGAIEDAQQVVL